MPIPAIQSGQPPPSQKANPTGPTNTPITTGSQFNGRQVGHLPGGSSVPAGTFGGVGASIGKDGILRAFLPSGTYSPKAFENGIRTKLMTYAAQLAQEPDKIPDYLRGSVGQQSDFVGIYRALVHEHAPDVRLSWDAADSNKPVWTPQGTYNRDQRAQLVPHIRGYAMFLSQHNDQIPSDIRATTGDKPDGFVPILRALMRKHFPAPAPKQQPAPQNTQPQAERPASPVSPQPQTPGSPGSAGPEAPPFSPQAAEPTPTPPKDKTPPSAPPFAFRAQTAARTNPAYQGGLSPTPLAAGKPYYHEIQTFGNCGMHAINAFVGGPVMDPANFEKGRQDNVRQVFGFSPNEDISAYLQTAGSDPGDIDFMLRSMAEKGIIDASAKNALPEDYMSGPKIAHRVKDFPGDRLILGFSRENQPHFVAARRNTDQTWTMIDSMRKEQKTFNLSEFIAAQPSIHIVHTDPEFRFKE